ncbi:MAG: hypothetical protein ACOCXC_04340 [Fibrobacterota bacterium]
MREMLVGYLTDMVCLRTWHHHMYLEKAREHATRCALEGEHVESGFALVLDDGQPVLLDSSATPLITEALGISSVEKGIRMRVEREMRDDRMKTVLVTTSD